MAWATRWSINWWIAAWCATWPISTTLKIEDLMSLERMGVKSAGNVIRNIDKSRKNPLPRVLTALGIRFVGERTAVFLAEAFGSMDAIEHASLEELQQAEEVGPKVAEAYCQYLPRAPQPRTGRAPAQGRPPVHLRLRPPQGRPAHRARPSSSPAPCPP